MRYSLPRSHWYLRHTQRLTISRPLPKVVCHLVRVGQVVDTDGVYRTESIRVIPGVEVSVVGPFVQNQFSEGRRHLDMIGGQLVSDVQHATQNKYSSPTGKAEP